jgi:chromosome segregation ATPase
LQEILDAIQILLWNMTELQSELAGWGSSLSQLVNSTALELHRELADAREVLGQALDSLTEEIEQLGEDQNLTLSRLEHLTLSTLSTTRILADLTDSIDQLKNDQTSALSRLEDLTNRTTQLEQSAVGILAALDNLTSTTTQVKHNMTDTAAALDNLNKTTTQLQDNATNMLAALDSLARSIARLDSAQKHQTQLLMALGAILVALTVAGCVITWRLARRGK